MNKVDLHINAFPKYNFCVKNHKFRMTWIEKYMNCL